jgi:hypothetical protein
MKMKTRSYKRLLMKMKMKDRSYNGAIAMPMDAGRD